MRNKLFLFILAFAALMESDAKAALVDIFEGGIHKQIEHTGKAAAGPLHLALGRGLAIRAAAEDFLRERPALALGSARLGEGLGLRFLRVDEGDVLSTVRYARDFQGVPLRGGEVLVQVDGGGVRQVNLGAAAPERLSLDGVMSVDTAKGLALAHYQGVPERAEAAQLVFLPRQEEEGAWSLAFEVNVRDRDNPLSSDVHYIDARTGEDLLVTTNMHTLLNRKILAGSGTDADMEMQGLADFQAVYREGGCSPQQVSCVPSSIPSGAKKAAATAWDYSGKVYNYFLRSHKRDSIDTKGMALQSIVNFGRRFNNAAWVNDLGVMIYGSGDGVEFHDFTRALDVAAHELTHGITSRTANLTYAAESGALNESYSDVFGKLVAFRNSAGRDWLLGKELFIDKGFIRDMEKPEIGHVRDYLYRNQRCTRDNDFCGVHSNSGIPNRAAVILAKSIGLDKLEKIYYLTLTRLLRASSNFRDAKQQTVSACQTLYGKSDSACVEVARAFQTVGI